MKIFDLQNKQAIKKAVETGQVKVAIYGMGKMGLPLACVFAQKSFQVLGVDIDEGVVKKINKGRNPVIGEPGLEELLKRVVKEKRLEATTNGVGVAKRVDVMVIVTPTFLKKDKKPDIDSVKKVARTIGMGINKGSLVILESTVPPGTTEGPVKSILEKESGFIAGVDFGLAFCPERTNSGTAIEDIKGRVNPKIVGGFDEKSLFLATSIYELINKKGVIRVSNCTVAEMVKLAEMVYRDVKIAYANFLALVCDQLGIDAKEVIEAANTDAGCEILRPGPGVGGHCIPVYPYFIFDKVKKNLDLLEGARKINDLMPDFVISLVEKVLGEKGRSLKTSKILVLGITYRGNVKETRLSPGIEIYKKLARKAREVFAFDPLYKKEELEKLGVVFKDDYQGLDCVIVTALHEEFKKLNFGKISKKMRTKTLVDTSLFFDPEKLKKLGFAVKSLGRSY